MVSADMCQILSILHRDEVLCTMDMPTLKGLQTQTVFVTIRKSFLNAFVQVYRMVMCDERRRPVELPCPL